MKGPVDCAIKKGSIMQSILSVFWSSNDLYLLKYHQLSRIPPNSKKRTREHCNEFTSIKWKHAKLICQQDNSVSFILTEMEIEVLYLQCTINHSHQYSTRISNNMIQTTAISSSPCSFCKQDTCARIIGNLVSKNRTNNLGPMTS